MNIKTKNKNAFTLIELLVVIAIIGILIGLSFFGLQGARQSSRDAKRKSDAEAIRSALEMYKADKGYYPLADGTEEEGWEVSWDGDWLVNLDSVYMPNKLVDPINTESSGYYYRYAKCDLSSSLPAGQKDYKILINLETITDAKNCSQCGGWIGGGSYECLTNP